MVVCFNGYPAQNAEVMFVPENYLPGLDTAGVSVVSTFSDRNGNYRLPELSDGVYNILFEKEQKRAYRTSVDISNGKTEAVLNDTLKYPGSVSGIVRLVGNHDNRNVFILVIGSDRYTSPYDSLGNFTIENLAEGIYSVKVIAGYENYGIIDTTITIKAGLDREISDTLFLPYRGIKPPDTFSVQYDTLLQQASLSWSHSSAPNLTGYNIYRKEYSTTRNFQQINNELITDTFFVDQANGISVLPGKSYLYSVTPVDEFGISSKPELVVKVKYVSNSTVSDSFFVSQPDVFASLVHHTNNNFALVNSNTSSLFMVSGTERDFSTFPLPDNALPYSVSVMEDSTFILATGNGVYNISPSGEKLYWYNIMTTMLASRQSRYIYYTTRSDFFSDINTIRILDTYTGFDSHFMTNKYGTIRAIYADSSTLYFAVTYQNQLVIKKSSLYKFNPVKIHRVLWNNSAVSICVNENEVAVSNGNIIMRFDKANYQLRERTVFVSPIISFALVPDGTTLFTLSEEGIIGIIN
ncbi:hypothetical protein CHISP_3568 [Chitinispirillum alkaliphilum]|nr:hypothetical protein CHISP_3568 [Chitinispirillum alkaliphilum]